MNGTWSRVPLKTVLKPVERPETPEPGKLYRQIGVRLWGQGAYEREPVDGGQTQYRTLNRVEASDVIVNKIWARNGSVAVVTDELAGSYASGEFPTFVFNRDKLEPMWFHWITKTPDFWGQCDEKSHGTSGKNRIRPEKFLEVEIPLPDPNEQRRIVARIEALAARIEEARGLHGSIEQVANSFLFNVYMELIEDADYIPMAKAAPIVRRPVNVELDEYYHELGIRSFGNGTFHKPALRGSEVGTKRIFWIEPGDLLFSNVFAWEGAIAVVKPEDAGRVGSHRFISCLPRKNVVTAPFLCFHFLTPEGLQQIGEASPGGAGRNRTLGLKKLERIEVPGPSYEKQVWFDGLQARVDDLKRLQAATAAELDALLPSILDKAFRGEL